MFPNHDVFMLFFRNHFLLFSASFFFSKVQSKIGVRIIHRRALYTGKYGTLEDTLIIPASKAECAANVGMVVTLLDDLGFKTNFKKSQVDPM